MCGALFCGAVQLCLILTCRGAWFRIRPMKRPLTNRFGREKGGARGPRFPLRHHFKPFSSAANGLISKL